MYGIEVKNNQGEVILDSNTPVYVEVASGVLNVNETFSPFAKRGALPAYSSRAVFAYRLPVGTWFSFWKNIVYSKTSASIEYKVFEPQDIVQQSSDEYGLRVYNENGGLIFDSGKVTFNVLSNEIFEANGNITPVFTNNNNTWMIPATAGVRGIAQISPVDGAFLSAFVRRESNNVISARVDTWNTAPFVDGSIIIPATCSSVRIDVL